MDKLTDLHYVGTNKAIVGMDTHGVWQTYTSGAVYDELASGKHGHIKPWVDVPAAPEPTVLDAVTFWERITEAEGVAIEAMLAQQPFRVRQIFMTAQSYRSDHELWPLLQSAATQLFGEQRTLELLAQP